MRHLPIFLTLILCKHALAWEPLPDFPGTPRDDAAVFSFGDHIYVGTGMDLNFNLTNDWFRYSVEWNGWTPAASLPASGRQYCSTFVIGNKGYLFGGLDANGPLNELWAYDPISDSWDQKASLPAEPRYACVGFANGAGIGIIATGIVNGDPTNEVWAYDPFTDQWTMREPFPGEPRHRACGLNDFQILIGGAHTDEDPLSDVWEYHSWSDSWSQLPDLPEARFGSSAVGFTGPTIIAGASSWATYHDGSFTLNLSNMVWNEQLPPFIGGPRKGGIGANGGIGGVGYIYYGLGVDQVQRYSDWYRVGIPLGVNDGPSTILSVQPNPATDRIIVMNTSSNSNYSIHDALGKILVQGTIRTGSIDVGRLAAGRYTLLVQNGERILRSNFIKLP